MKCINVKTLIPAFTDKELEDRDYEEVANHLSHCSDCSNELKEWQNIKLFLQTIGSQEIVAPTGLQNAVLNQLKHEKTWEEGITSENLIPRTVPAVGVFTFLNKFSTRIRKGIAAAAAVILIGTTAGGLWLQNGAIIADSGNEARPPLIQQKDPVKQPEALALRKETQDDVIETDSGEKDTTTLNPDTAQKPSDNNPESEQSNSSSQNKAVPDNSTAGQSSVPKVVNTDPKPQAVIQEQTSDVVLLRTEKIIHSGYVKIQANNLTALHEAATAVAGKYGAASTVQSLGQAENGATREMVKFTVPKDNFNGLYNNLLTLGQLVDKGLADDNISERYSQTDAQLLELKAQIQQPNQSLAQQKQTKEKISALEEQLYRWDQATKVGTIALWLEGTSG